jgi:hypothetical protein
VPLARHKSAPIRIVITLPLVFPDEHDEHRALLPRAFTAPRLLASLIAVLDTQPTAQDPRHAPRLQPALAFLGAYDLRRMAGRHSPA